MGKGDKKTKKGKIFMGSYGVSRPQKAVAPVIVKKEKVAKVAKTEEPKVKKTVAKKPAVTQE